MEHENNWQKELTELLLIYNSFFTNRCHRYAAAPGEYITTLIADRIKELIPAEKIGGLVARIHKTIPKHEHHLWYPLIMVLQYGIYPYPDGIADNPDRDEPIADYTMTGDRSSAIAARMAEIIAESNFRQQSRDI